MRIRSMNPLHEPSLLQAFQAKHWRGLLCIPFLTVHAFADQKQAFEQTIQPVLKQ